MKMRKNIKELFYITHIDNLPSILEHGILSHRLVEDSQIETERIYDSQIVTNRAQKRAPDGRSLWNFANLYFQPRNPMLYRVLSEKKKDNIVILGIQPDLLDGQDVFVTTGNAASYESTILPAQHGLKEIFQMWNIIQNEWWKPEDGSKRKIMAECLIPERVSPDFIKTIYVANHTIADRVRDTLKHPTIPIVPEPRLFFQPSWSSRLIEGLYLIEGDMFFSQMHTLTISVNTVGVMGKGLASRAKYQFPDVYVIYQDVCRQKRLQMGQPYLYKRETFIDNELVDDPATFSNPNAMKWFLLFPTKRHWKNRSDIIGIEKGLQWVENNYKTEGIQSLAVPALGCGLGGLKWRDVGPLMCQYFSRIEIPVSIYLPREQPIPPEMLTKDFLLK